MCADLHVAERTCLRNIVGRERVAQESLMTFLFLNKLKNGFLLVAENEMKPAECVNTHIMKIIIATELQIWFLTRYSKQTPNFNGFYNHAYKSAKTTDN